MNKINRVQIKYELINGVVRSIAFSIFSLLQIYKYGYVPAYQC